LCNTKCDRIDFPQTTEVIYSDLSDTVVLYFLQLKELVMRKIVVFFLICLCCFGLVSAQDGGGNVLIMARSADTTGLDPHTQTAFASFRLLELIYDPLVNLDEN